MILILSLFFSFLLFKVFISILNDPTNRRKLDISIVFSPPGGGKTTTLCRYAEQAGTARKNKPQFIYSNVDLVYPFVTKINREDLGRYNFHDCLILIDEAGVDFNNRDYKNLSKDLIKYLKYHRHFDAQIVFFSQSYDDMDITIRRLAQRYYLVKKTIFHFISKRFVIRRIKKVIDIQKDSKQIIDAYDFVAFSKFRFSGKKYFPHFNTKERYYLPEFNSNRSIKS